MVAPIGHLELSILNAGTCAGSFSPGTLKGAALYISGRGGYSVTVTATVTGRGNSHGPVTRV